jgi:hypothetical protein
MNAVTQQAAKGQPPRQQMPCCLGVNVCKKAHLMEKCEQFRRCHLSSES